MQDMINPRLHMAAVETQANRQPWEPLLMATSKSIQIPMELLKVS